MKGNCRKGLFGGFFHHLHNGKTIRILPEILTGVIAKTSLATIVAIVTTANVATYSENYEVLSCKTIDAHSIKVLFGTVFLLLF
ncbi:hypothetical protein IEQ34_013659 [Dendrobium chrysotoxum]|uniref:Uncharacterized protein n=1 Tax=Dendrobium chrysotoxum TaxID=161865 RepID=A0AAV7GS69_DENCH|nr:hypothetical protein IEQ34_013659 [Dendrobium chrysotoxum]